MTVAAHQRENAERTDGLIRRLQHLIGLANHVATADAEVIFDIDRLGTVHTLGEIMQETLAQVHLARAMEWAGVGGSTGTLTPEEVALARGEA